MANYDFQLVPDGNGNDDIYIDPVTGDFVIVTSDQQHIKDTVATFPGWWKQYPADGVGAFAYLGSAGQIQQLSRSIKLQLQNDGYTVKNPQINYNPGGQLTINPDASL
jgi:hypothetical protein